MSRFVPVLIAAVAVAVIAVRAGRGRRPLALRDWRRRRAAKARRPVLGVIGLVAAREIRQRLRGRVFLVATALLLVGVAAAVIVPVATKGNPRPRDVGVVGTPTPSLRAAVVAAGASVRADVRVRAEPDLASAQNAVRSGRIDVAVTDSGRLLVKRAVSGGDTSQTATFVRALAQALGVDDAVRAAGLTPAQRARLASARPLPVTALRPARTGGPERVTATIGLIVLVVMLTQYLSWTLIGVMEEKSSRVVEVILAAVRPRQLLTGKVIGIGVVVFAQAALVAALALVLATAVGSDLVHGSAPLVVLAIVLWLLFGYAFYCWLYAAAGSMAERQDQVQSLAIPLALPIIATYILSITALSSGNPPPLYLEVLAYLPPTAPFAMTTLVGLGAVSWWQFALSAAISAASTVAVARLAAGIYRRAILRTGRRVRLGEIISARSGP